jgi:hypothetical protein
MATMQHVIKINSIVCEITKATGKEIFADFHGYPIRLLLGKKRAIVRDHATGKFVSYPVSI